MKAKTAWPTTSGSDYGGPSTDETRYDAGKHDDRQPARRDPIHCCIWLTAAFCLLALIGVGVYILVQWKTRPTIITKSLHLLDHKNAPLLCRMTTVETMFVGEFDDDYEEEIHVCIPVVAGKESYVTLRIDPFLPEALVEEYAVELAEGSLLVHVYQARISDNTLYLDEASEFQVSTDESRYAPPIEDGNEIDNTPSTLVRRRKQVVGMGNRTVFLVRVTTADGLAPNVTLEEWWFHLFGPTESSNFTNFTTVDTTIQSQYAACSFGQLQFDYIGHLEVTLKQNLSAYVGDWYSMGIDAQREVIAYYSNLTNSSFFDITTLADHLLFVLPEGTGNWAALAPVRHWLVLFHDEWALSHIAGLHELGHNLGLLHSGDGSDRYADKTGYMGYGQLRQTGPLKCFNALKHHQLKWYQDKELYIREPEIPGVYELVAFVDYDKIWPDEQQYVLINIKNRYYIQYNRAKSFNRETEEFKNRAVVIENTEETVGWSLFRAGLAEGQVWWSTSEDAAINSAQDGHLFINGENRTLVIQVCRQQVNGAPMSASPSPVGVEEEDEDVIDSMLISIGLDVSYCDQFLTPSAMPSRFPTLAPTKTPAPTLTHTPSSAPPTLAPTVSVGPIRAPTLAPTTLPPTFTSLPTETPCLARREACIKSEECCGQQAACIGATFMSRQCLACRRESKSCNRGDECCGDLKCKRKVCVET